MAPPDPTTTHGKHLAEAQRIESRGQDCRKHVAGRACGVMLHGDAAVQVATRNVARSVVQAVKELRAGPQ